MENCGNSCYIDSVIFAMFHDGMNESYDGILVQDLKDDKTSAVQRILRDVVVTQLRRREAVKAPDMSKLRLALNLCGWEGFAVGSGGNEDVRRLVEMGFSHQHAVLSLIANDGKVDSAISQLLSRDPGMDTEIDKSIMSKYRQQDALEFLQFFLDLLKAPRIPFSQRILKNMGGSAPAAKSSTDMKYVTDRAVLLNLVQQPKNLFATSRNAVRLEDLLRRHFYDDQIEVAGASSQSKSVLKVLKLSPFYTNDCEIDGCTYNGEASLFPNFIIPIVLLRYGYNSSASKNSCPVAFPETLDVSRYIDKDSSLPLPEYMLVLRSLVLHVGDRANEGHYVSIGR
ncbi:hypothetical protein GUITHDRAFT_141476 [Guillardia theta CCMP2712]|uniref:ubiquitinyl hydrolase 1 n=2 Tax=Guillardia theta TaxID=55529 RepID=L1J1N3_GUITC|nr:hypothetical protein GUITHDRAFT_141476 [Guillardia theta CCMP2712]EKX41995.1 hypothetical protein GUITHDRAFT_141476 [Guillardia theta CCMP2712]|eukprot:XP_005828975.1 hypothetical protein GUITHDRAFT_141476 [Guillardia theta CCMP2712]